MEPTQGTNHESFIRHVKENICSGNAALAEYVFGWMARAVQMPGEQGHTSIVLRGDQGVGKGFFANALGRLFGRHFLSVSNAQHLTGNFNAHLRDCVVLFADEAFYAGDKKHASTLKSIVTEPELMIEGKGIDSETSNNCLHIIMASNEYWVVPAGYKERRFCVLDVSAKHIQDTNYFGHIADDLKDGGYGHLLYFLLNYDITGFDVRKLPATDALQDQKLASMDAMHDWFYSKLRDGLLLQGHDGWLDEVAVEELKMDYFDTMREQGAHRRGNTTKWMKFLESACPGELKRVQKRETITINERSIHRPYYFKFPSIEEMRKHWDKNFGGPYSWPEIEDFADPTDGKPPF